MKPNTATGSDRGRPVNGARRAGRVIYVCTDPGIPVFGDKGSSVHVRAMLTQLVRRSDEVHLVTVRAGGTAPEELAGVHVHELPRPSGPPAEREAALCRLDDVAAAWVEAIAGDHDIDLLYQRYSLWSCAPMELAAHRRWPSVLEINAPLLDEQARHRSLVDRRTARDRTERAIRATRFAFGVTSGVAAWAETLAQRPVAVVSNGVDPGRFPITPAPRGRQEYRSDETGCGRSPAGLTSGDEERLTIGFVGTFKPWHDLATLVRAVDCLSEDAAVAPLRLLLVGDGPRRGAVLEHLGALGDSVTVDAPGAVATERIPELLGEMDLAVAPYGTDEQYFSPLKVFEYLAAGVPVVASRIDGLDGLLEPHEARLVPPGDLSAFTASLRELCLEPRTRRSLGRAGRFAARTRFGWDAVTERILASVYERSAA